VDIPPIRVLVVSHSRRGAMSLTELSRLWKKRFRHIRLLMKNALDARILRLILGASRCVQVTSQKQYSINARNAVINGEAEDKSYRKIKYKRYGK
jgi:hypothetical protein